MASQDSSAARATPAVAAAPAAAHRPRAAAAWLTIAAACLVLAGCAGGPRGGARDGAPARGADRQSVTTPDAEPRVEPIRASGGTSKPYTVLGRTYVPITDDRPLRESGLASWYGSQFHSRSTASGEPYDMYAMTAAHKTLPLPSYVRVRNPANGREAIVRVNDRGPFHDDRVIDLSYGAAHKLDLLRGVAPVEIERITNEDIRTGAWRRGGDAAVFAKAAAPVQVSAPMPVPVRATAAAPPARLAAAAVPAASAAPATPAASQTLPASATLLVPVAAGAADLPTALPSSSPLPSASGSAPPSPSPSPSDAAVPDTVFTSPVMAPPRAEAAELPALAAPPSPGLRETLPDAPAVPPPAGYWVQLGAFSQRDGALAFQKRMALGMPSLAPALQVFSEGGMHRVQAGPYASRETARGAAEQVRDGLRLAPVVVERR